MTVKTGKSYSVKDWFANKVANELGRNISMCDVFAILKETEKAVYAMLNLGTFSKKTMWIPKSVLIENEVGKAESGYNHETLIEADYEKCCFEFKHHWNTYV